MEYFFTNDGCVVVFKDAVRFYEPPGIEFKGIMRVGSSQIFMPRLEHMEHFKERKQNGTDCVLRGR